MLWILYLLCLWSLLGSADILYYHLYRYRLYRSDSSRREQWTHLVRLILFPMAMVWVLFVHASGWQASGLLFLLVLDFLNALLDASFEPKSREPLGGLPRGEYVLHMVLMGLSGGVLVLSVLQCVGAWNQPPGLAWQVLEAPRWIKALGFQLAVGSLLLFAVEAFGFFAKGFKTSPR